MIKNYHPYPLYDGMDSLHILLLKGGQVIKTHIETGDTLLSSCYIPQMYYTPHCIDTKASGQYTELLANRMRLHEIDADKAPTSFPIFYTTQRTAPSSPHEPYVPYNPDDPEWNWTLSDIYYQFPFEVCDQLLERSQGKYIEEGDRFGFW